MASTIMRSPEHEGILVAFFVFHQHMGRMPWPKKTTTP